MRRCQREYTPEVLALLFAIGLQSKHIEEKCFRKKSFLKSLPYQSTNTGNQHLKNDRTYLFARATTVSYLSSTIFSNYSDPSYFQNF
uniref:Putative ovule protein n=1 Tax=Solanum chacoense TaxID=4108 RepID=A0A0V0H0V8_SOLCH